MTKIYFKIREIKGRLQINKSTFDNDRKVMKCQQLDPKIENVFSMKTTIMTKITAEPIESEHLLNYC